MNHLLFVIAGLLGLLIGLVLADREFIDDIRDERLAILEEKLQAKLMPSIHIEKASVWTGAGEVVVQEVGKAKKK